MYIKELQVDNFKSFANDMTIPFLKGFTTISGPNGSGKSNIIDSILFALGLASVRNLRMEQLSDFISTHTKKNEAYVKVVFEPENDEEEQLSVARKIRKSSSGFNSVYYLNDQVSTLTEIHTKLEKYRITPNSYNVVMQNDVMSITNCSTVERRKIVDEIAGIADFNRRIEKAQEELLTVEERVENATLILTEIESSIERLAEEKETALKYQKLKTEKFQLESQITTVKYFDTKRNLELAHQNILEFNKKKKEEEGNLKKLENTLLEIKKRYNEISELVKNNGEAEQIETKKQLEELKGQISRKNLAISATEKTIHDNLKTIENSKNGIENHKEKIQEITAKIEEKKAEIEKIEANIKIQEAELTKILEEVSGLNKNADKQLEERNNLKKELEKLKEQEWDIKSDSIPLETELATTKKDVENAKKSLAELNNFKANFKDNQDKLKLQVEELTKEQNDYKLAQENVMYNLDKNKNEMSDLMYDIQAAQRKMLTLEAQKNAYEEMNLGRAIDSILKAKIRGVHAPLLQLGSVDKEYSTALEVAMGGRMKNIVVDDVDVARTCIDYLKSARAGSATFLPLDKMKPAPTSLKLPKEKGVIDYAINLVDFDDKYLDAFFYALGDTLIVEDYDCAKRLIGKFRLVTLDGSLFEKSGAITGGDRRDTGLKFSQNQDEELTKYKKRFEELQKQYQTLDATRKELEAKQEKIRTNYSNTMTALNGAKIELNNLNNNAQNNEQRIEEYNKIIKENEPKIQAIEKKLEKYEEKLVDLNDKMLTLQDKITEIESKMTEGELKKLKEMTAAIENQIKEYQTKILRINNEINDANRNIDFNNDLIRNKEEQIQKLIKDNEIAAVDKEKYAEEIKAIEVKATELEEKIKTLGEKLVQLQQQRDLVQEELLSAETNKNKVINEIERIGEQVEAFKARRRELEPQLEEIREELKANEVDINLLVPTEISTEEITAKIQRLQKRMEDMEPVNMLAIQTYDEVKARQEEKQAQIATLTNERKQILEKMSGYEQIKKETFMQTYNNINDNFVEIFGKLSEGEGKLILENPENPFEGGLTIQAQLRDKQKQKLGALSGGEKTLTALSFVFAIQKYLPAPFYALDEVDANLDGINVEKLAEMIQEQAKNTQFVVVSHRKPMIESANRTIGVTQKEKGKTRVTGVKLRD
ncbi:MAG: chromosome segregation protein SMC [Candidatus Gastranaerophilales bacterium]|nr:chromosome segregation protein SMC [Candidatus Gastranaerophilales bacterium]